MTIHSQPKRRASGPPERCDRCKARMGASQLHFMRAPDAPRDASEPATVWLCAPCAAEARRAAQEN